MNPKDSVGAKKAPLRYVPAALEIGASEAMDIGQRKYGPFNWRKQPVSAMTYAEAVKRHLAAWIDGQDDAEDTGIHHWKHIAASAAIILDALGIEGGLLDDRPQAGPAADLLRKLDKSERAEDVEAMRADTQVALASAMAQLDLSPPPVIVMPEPWGTGDGPVHRLWTDDDKARAEAKYGCLEADNCFARGWHADVREPEPFFQRLVGHEGSSACLVKLTGHHDFTCPLWMAGE